MGLKTYQGAGDGTIEGVHERFWFTSCDTSRKRTSFLRCIAISESNQPLSMVCPPHSKTWPSGFCIPSQAYCSTTLKPEGVPLLPEFWQGMNLRVNLVTLWACFIQIQIQSDMYFFKNSYPFICMHSFINVHNSLYRTSIWHVLQDINESLISEPP